MRVRSELSQGVEGATARTNHFNICSIKIGNQLLRSLEGKGNE